MRRKENRYNPDLVAGFREIDKAKQEFVDTLQAKGLLDESFVGKSYDELLAQGQLPDMRLTPNRHNPDLVEAFGKIVGATDRVKQKAQEIANKKTEKKEEPEHLRGPFEESKPGPGKKSKGTTHSA
jgi:hypothetical protein